MSRTLRYYSEAEKQQLLEEYFSSNMSQYAFARLRNIPQPTFNHWARSCQFEKKVLSLHPNLTIMDAKEQVIHDLQLENERLKKEVEYQRLKTAAYERLIEIVKIEDGIDLLKKGGAKQ